MARIFFYFMLVATLATHSTAYAAYKETGNVKVKLISVLGSSGSILVQTSPKPDISGLSCTSDFWLQAYKADPGYNALLSLLLAAQASQINVTVRADDSVVSGEFCKLDRVITTAN